MIYEIFAFTWTTLSLLLSGPMYLEIGKYEDTFEYQPNPQFLLDHALNDSTPDNDINSQCSASGKSNSLLLWYFINFFYSYRLRSLRRWLLQQFYQKTGFSWPAGNKLTCNNFIAMLNSTIKSSLWCLGYSCYLHHHAYLSPAAVTPSLQFFQHKIHHAILPPPDPHATHPSP